MVTRVVEKIFGNAFVIKYELNEGCRI